MADHQQEQRLLSMVLDGLDDLYDQRFGAPVGGERTTRAEVWLVRLLVSAGVALQGSAWEARLLQVASEIQALIRVGLRGNDLTDRALDATDALRQALAAEI